MRKIVYICLLILSVNAVLIQTIVSDNSFLKNGIRISILFVMVLFMLISKQRISVGILFLVNASVIFLLLGRNPDQLSFIFVFVFIQGMLFMKTKKVEKYLLMSSLLSLLLVFVFLALGITQNTVLDYRNRMTFGTNGVPFFYNLVYGTFTLLVIYSKKYFTKMKMLTILFSIAATTYFYMMTDARGGYFSFLIFLVLLFIIPIISKLTLFRFIVASIPILFVGTAYFISSLHNNLYANDVLSVRPILLYKFFSSISLSDAFLSTSVKSFNDANNIVDNSYLHLLIGGGILLSIAFMYLFVKAILNLYKHKKYIEISFIISTCIYFNTESLLVRIENMFVIYFWYLILKYSLTKVKVEAVDVKQNEDSTKVIKRRRFKKHKIVW